MLNKNKIFYESLGAKVYSYVIRTKPLIDFYEQVISDISMATKDGGFCLDIGTGPGLIPIRLAQMNPNLKAYGLDISSDMIDYSNNNASKAGVSDRTEFIVANASGLDFEDNYFDIVFSTLCFHLWPNPIQYLNEIYRILKPGGATWIYDTWRDPPREAIDAFREKYGWFWGRTRGALLPFCRGKLTTKWVNSLQKGDSTLKFKEIKVEHRDIVILIKFVKS